MSYLTDNTNIAAELRANLSLEMDSPGEWIGCGNTMETHESGIQHVGFGLEVPVAAKYFAKAMDYEEFSADRNKIKFARGLGFISIIHERLPQHASRLPLFYLMLEDSSGQPVGQLTEDFSQSGEYAVRDYPWSDRPQEVNNIAKDVEQLVETLLEEKFPDEQRLRPDDDFVARMLNEVYGLGPRFVDLFGSAVEFDPWLRVGLDERNNFEPAINNMFGADAILENLAAHTITVNGKAS